MMPLYGFLQGDCVGLLVLAEPEQTVGELAEQLQLSAAVRVPRRERVAVLAFGRRLDPLQSVATAGLKALDRFDVVADAADGS
jgi:hypothetical protein